MKKIDISSFLERKNKNTFLIKSSFLILNIGILIEKIISFLEKKKGINFFRLLGDPIKILVIYDEYLFIDEEKFKNTTLIKVSLNLLNDYEIKQLLNIEQKTYDSIIILSHSFLEKDKFNFKEKLESYPNFIFLSGVKNGA